MSIDASILSAAISTGNAVPALAKSAVKRTRLIGNLIFTTGSGIQQLFAPGFFVGDFTMLNPFLLANGSVPDFKLYYGPAGAEVPLANWTNVRGTPGDYGSTPWANTVYNGVAPAGARIAYSTNATSGTGMGLNYAILS